MIRGVALRELGRRSLSTSLSAFAVAGVAAGLAAASLPPNSAGSATLITQFDRTLIGVVGWIAVFRTISRLSVDASPDWLLQLVANGASREVYAGSVALSVATASILAWTAGACAFAFTFLARTSQTAPALRVLHDALLVPLPIAAACAFGCAAVCVFGRNMAARVAFVLMAAPWVALWLTIAARGDINGSTLYLQWLGYPVPRLYVSATLANVSYMFVYIGVAFGIVAATANRRIGRRE